MESTLAEKVEVLEGLFEEANKIVVMGGSGKTTLAEEFMNKKIGEDQSIEYMNLGDVPLKDRVGFVTGFLAALPDMDYVIVDEVEKVQDSLQLIETFKARDEYKFLFVTSDKSFVDHYVDSLEIDGIVEL